MSDHFLKPRDLFSLSYFEDRLRRLLLNFILRRLCSNDVDLVVAFYEISNGGYFQLG